MVCINVKHTFSLDSGYTLSHEVDIRIGCHCSWFMMQIILFIFRREYSIKIHNYTLSYSFC